MFGVIPVPSFPTTPTTGVIPNVPWQAAGSSSGSSTQAQSGAGGSASGGFGSTVVVTVGGSVGGSASTGSGGISNAQLAQYAAQQQLQLLAQSQYAGLLNSYQNALGASASPSVQQLSQLYGAASAVLSPVAPAAPLKTTSFRLGEIIAYRGWRWEGGLLWSMSAGTPWAPGEPMDGKTRSTAEHNGVYAYKKLRDFLKNHSGSGMIYGTVALWGDVIEHELGYRAEWAKVLTLDGIVGVREICGVSAKQTLAEAREVYGLAA